MINSCYIETKEGYVVIDSGPTYNYAKDGYALMEKIKKLPVKYVINTSSEEEHILGNGFFKEQGAKLLGPMSYKQHLIEKKELNIKKMLPPDIIEHTKLVPLDEYIDSSNKRILLGGLDIEVKSIKNDKEHLIVYLPSKRILFAGDMIFNNRIVPLRNGRSLSTWQEGLTLIDSLGWDDIVSAHGYMTLRSALKRTQSYLEQLKSEVQWGLENHLTKKKAIQTITLSSFSGDRLYAFWHPRNVAVVYDEFKYKMKRDSKPIQVERKKSTPPLKVTPVVKIKKMPKRRSVPSVKYVDFKSAVKRARKERKLIFIKVRSTTCKYCDELDAVIAEKDKVKKLLNRYFEVVKVNTDYEELPIDVRISSTPTLIFMQPNSSEPLMHLTGIRALGEFFGILKELVSDGHNGGYLKP